jgi:hypothetical protein
MKTPMRNFLTLLMICCCLCGPVQAEHDSGLGKRVAPEPSTLLIFLLGSLGLAAAYRQKSTKYLPEDR